MENKTMEVILNCRKIKYINYLIGQDENFQKLNPDFKPFTFDFIWKCPYTIFDNDGISPTLKRSIVIWAVNRKQAISLLAYNFKDTLILPGSREGQEPGSREPGSREPEPGSREPGAREPGSQEPGSQDRKRKAKPRLKRLDMLPDTY